MNNWKLNIPKIGIYKIQSKVHPERIYIGSSVNIRKRLNEHRRKLFINEHDSPKLQDHFNKYFWQDLDCSIIEECEKDNLIQREQHYIDTLNPWFNICRIAGNCLYKKHTEETKRKLKIARNKRGPFGGWHHTEETKKIWSEQRKGRKNSLESIAKTAEKNRGKKRTDEFKERMRLMKIGEKNYAWGKPAHNRGSHHTIESRAKMSESHKNPSEETRKK